MYTFEVGERKYTYSTIDNRITNFIANSNRNDNACLHTQYEACHDHEFDKMSMFTIEVTQQCNLRCRYCCYSGSYERHRTHNDLFMSIETATKCIHFIKRHTDNDAKLITICFYGGEALLAKERIKYIIDNIRREMPHTNFLFSISTNGTLLNESVADWLCSDKDIIATITIDGDSKNHDKNRIMPTGNGSFDIIMRNLWSFKKRHPEQFHKKTQFISTLKSPSELMTLNEFWMNNELLHENRPQHISMIIPNKRRGEEVTIDRNTYTQVLDKAIHDTETDEENILTDELHRLISRIEHRSICTLPQTQRFVSCINQPYSCFITADGNLYVCERFCTELNIGTLSDSIDIVKCQNIYNEFLTLKRNHCSSCWAQRLCRRCALCLNEMEDFTHQCEAEKERIRLALKYYCRYLLIKKDW